MAGEGRWHPMGRRWMARGIPVFFVGIAAIIGCGSSTTDSSPAQPSTGGGDGIGGAGGAVAPDPFAVAPTCTSGALWTRANHGSPEMNPGRACIACHTTDDGPAFTIAGTVFPTAHEPDLCDGADGSEGFLVTILGADGQVLTLTPNAVGNFDSAAKVALPYQAKVSYLGRERAMAVVQTSGDCNGCHTQSGANSAPGRILLP
jgi:hypothetical protein